MSVVDTFLIVLHWFQKTHGFWIWLCWHWNEHVFFYAYLCEVIGMCAMCSSQQFLTFRLVVVLKEGEHFSYWMALLTTTFENTCTLPLLIFISSFKECCCKSCKVAVVMISWGSEMSSSSDMSFTADQLEKMMLAKSIVAR